MELIFKRKKSEQGTSRRSFGQFAAEPPGLHTQCFIIGKLFRSTAQTHAIRRFTEKAQSFLVVLGCKKLLQLL